MSLPSRLFSVPTEVLCTVISFLLPPDQAALARACKRFDAIITPIIWRDIELHHRGTHEGIADLERPELDPDGGPVNGKTASGDVQYPHKELIYRPSSRAYSQPWDPRLWAENLTTMEERGRGHWGLPGRATDNCNRRNFQFGREEMFAKVKRCTPKARWNVLAGHIRSLCMSIGVDTEVIEVISSLRNLVSLELIGLPLEKGHPADAPEIRLPALKNLKLRGYFPVSLVQEICSNAQHISHLNLGLLATPSDDKARHVAFLGGEADEADEAEDSDLDEDEEEPWALHSPIWLPQTLPGKLTALTHLHLVRPHSSHTRMFGDDFMQVPTAFERALCNEWVDLLRGTAATLRELILEHRVPRCEGATVGNGGYTSEAKDSMGRYGRYSRASWDVGDIMFCRTVLCFLFENSGLFPILQRLAIRGIQINDIATTNSVDVPGQDGVPNNDRLLKSVFSNCDIELYEPAYPVHVYAGDVFQHWPANRHEAMQDEGDGLLYNLAYHNDYRMTFGPQWKITD